MQEGFFEKEESLELVESIPAEIYRYQKFKKDFMENIDSSAMDAQIFVDAKEHTCFTTDMVQKMSERADLKIIITFVYKGEKYQLIKPAGLDIKSILEEKDYYGLLYINDKINRWKERLQ